MTPEELTAAAAHSREAMTAIRHIAEHGGVGGMTYVMTSAEDVPGLLAHIAGQDQVVADQEARLIAQAERIAWLETELDRVRATFTEQRAACERHAAEVDKLRARVESITAERDHAEEQVHKIRMLKFWTNEDRKDFFFAADVWDITDPGRHGRPAESAPEPVTTQRPLTGRCGICLKGVHQPVGEDWSHYAMPLPYHPVDGVTVNEPKPAVEELPECCPGADGTTRYCTTCGGYWSDGEPYRQCTYTCTHGDRCDIAEPRAWHHHKHSHDGDNNGHTWSTQAAEQNPHARCAHAEQHHAHRWGKPAHWCDGTPITTPAVPEKETTP